MQLHELRQPALARRTDAARAEALLNDDVDWLNHLHAMHAWHERRALTCSPEGFSPSHAETIRAGNQHAARALDYANLIEDATRELETQAVRN